MVQEIQEVHHGNGGPHSNPTSGGGSPGGGPLQAIHLVAMDEFIHLRHNEHPHSRQEELVNLAEVLVHLLAHLHIHLLNDLLTHGHN